MSSVEKIKEQLGIVDVVSSYIKLEKAGANFKAKCPFHGEKTPSFFVSPQRNSFYCFGCGAKGDIFTFVEQFEGLDFKGALHLLGQRAGVEIVPENKEKKDEKDRLYTILETACLFFERKLADNKKAKDYLEKRGLKKETVKNWRVGFAPAEWRALHEYLLKKEFTEEEMKRAGLLKESNGKVYDTFRGRIMFPIADSSGRIVAFSGRIFEEGNASGKEAPKYVNTPETILFNKSRIMYGLDKSKRYIRPFNFSIVVEGQLDILMSHQTPFKNTVAISGTALTNDQLKRLKQLSENIVLAFDSDDAGINSTGKSAIRALSLGMDVKVALLPKDSDPADIVLLGVEKWKEIIKNSLHIIDFAIHILKEKELDKRKFHIEVSKKVLPYVSVIPNKIEQSHFINKIASILEVGPEIVKEEVDKIDPKDFREFSEVKEQEKNVPLAEKIDNSLYTRKTLIERRLSGIILWQESMEKPTIDIGKLREDCKKLTGVCGILEKAKENPPEYEDLLFEVENFYKETDSIQEDVDELIENVKKESLREEFEEVLRTLRVAEKEGDEKEAEKLRKKCQIITKKIDKI